MYTFPKISFSEQFDCLTVLNFRIFKSFTCDHCQQEYCSEQDLERHLTHHYWFLCYRTCMSQAWYGIYRDLHLCRGLTRLGLPCICTDL